MTSSCIKPIKRACPPGIVEVIGLSCSLSLPLCPLPLCTQGLVTAPGGSDPDPATEADPAASTAAGSRRRSTATQQSTLQQQQPLLLQHDSAVSRVDQLMLLAAHWVAHLPFTHQGWLGRAAGRAWASNADAVALAAGGCVEHAHLLAGYFMELGQQVREEAWVQLARRWDNAVEVGETE